MAQPRRGVANNLRTPIRKLVNKARPLDLAQALIRVQDLPENDAAAKAT